MKNNGNNRSAEKACAVHPLNKCKVYILVPLEVHLSTQASVLNHKSASFYKSLGVTNSVSYNYEHLGILSFKYNNEEEILELLLNAGIEINDIESMDGEIILSMNPSDMNKVKDELEKNIKDIDYVIDEVGMYAKDKITLEGEDLEIFNKLYKMLDDIEDVSEIYTNVIMD